MHDYLFRPEHIQVGSVYHYVKTNLDGTQPEHVSHYMAAPDQLVAFKFNPGYVRAALVTATLDWSLFCAVRLDSRQVWAGGEQRLVASMVYHPADQAITAVMPADDSPPPRTAVPHLPFHVYNFDFGSLNVAFPHRRDPYAPLTIGVLDPDFSAGRLSLYYRGAATITYQLDEDRYSTPCHRYAIDGPGLARRGGTLWADRATGRFVDIEIDLPDNPEWQSFKFRLLGVEQMGDTQWQQFVRAQLA